MKIHSDIIRSRFSLVELLVVVAIVAILLTILQPSLARAHSSALSLKCKNQLAHIGLANSVYFQDFSAYAPFNFHARMEYGMDQWVRHDNRYFGAPIYLTAFVGVPKEMFWCPEDSRALSDPDRFDTIVKGLQDETAITKSDPGDRKYGYHQVPPQRFFTNEIFSLGGKKKNAYYPGPVDENSYPESVFFVDRTYNTLSSSYAWTGVWGRLYHGTGTHMARHDGSVDHVDLIEKSQPEEGIFVGPRNNSRNSALFEGDLKLFLK